MTRTTIRRGDNTQLASVSFVDDLTAAPVAKKADKPATTKETATEKSTEKKVAPVKKPAAKKSTDKKEAKK